jgi:RNA polymerase sigma-70 factor, ECF subfamily
MSEIDLGKFRSALLLLARAQVARQACADIEPSDLVQQTLLEAHRDRQQCTGQTDEERFAWLRKVLRHTLLDACDRAQTGKRAISRQALEANLTQSFVGLDELLIAPDTSPTDRAMRNEQLALLAEALEQLPAQQQETVLLKHFAGLTLNEISERLGCTAAATAGLLFRGRQRLKELLEER